MNQQTFPCLAVAVMIGASATALNASAQALAQDAAPFAQPWLDPKLQADTRADLVVKAMTQDEKLTLVFGYFGADMQPRYTRIAGALPGSAGYVKGIPRLGIPAQWQTDAGIGVATQGSAKEFRERTALPSGIASTASWNPGLAFKGGAMIGSEARNSGFNVLLGGGVNLVRDPRNGRNFEYGGEDPLLASAMIAPHIKGIQSNRIVSTIKHLALNNQETGRFALSANIGDAAARMSDLLAFQLAIEQSSPHSVMCAYNRINGVHACENDWLMNTVLKKDFAYKGYVMSDWGAVKSGAKSVNAGLDQQSAGDAFDQQNFLGSVLKADLKSGAVSEARLDDMARRITRALFASGAVDDPVKMAPIDLKANGLVSQVTAEEGMVLLKNDGGLLPLVKGARSAKTIAVIGAHADVGVLSGGGSSQVYPAGGRAVQGLQPATWPGPVIYFPSSPMAALQARYPDAKFTFHDGNDATAAAKLAAGSDLAIVFADQWTTESEDVWTLNLPKNQDALISAVAKANAKTVVVLETGGPVVMPWLADVSAVLQAWYPGTNGGEAIARVLTGEVNASGRLPVTFPRDVMQLPRPKLDGDPKSPYAPFDVDYTIEGAAVGYKWFDKQGHQPLFPFGYGLSYTRFEFSGLKAADVDGVLTVSFAVKNTGARAGKAVPQVYVSPRAGGWEAPKRLAGFSKVELAPGASTRVSLTVDRRLLSVWEPKAHGWSVAAGDYDVTLGASSRAVSATTRVALKAQALPVSPLAR